MKIYEFQLRDLDTKEIEACRLQLPDHMPPSPAIMALCGRSYELAHIREVPQAPPAPPEPSKDGGVRAARACRRKEGH